VGWVVSKAGALPGGLETILWSVLASVTLQAGIAIWEFHTGRMLNLYSTSGSVVFGQNYFFTFGGENRPTGSFYDPISFGNFLALACPLGLVLTATVRPIAARVVTTAALFVTGLGLVLSLSRASWIGAIAGMIVTFLCLRPDYRARAAATVVILGAVVIVLALGLARGSISERFTSIFHPTSPTVETRQGDLQRTQLWRAALNTAEAHPAFGVGLGDLLPNLQRNVGGVTLNSQAQSTYLQTLGEAGIAGGLALVLVFGGLANDLVRGLARRRTYYAGFAGALVSILCTWITDYTIRYAAVAACFAIVFGAIASNGSRKTA